MKVRPAILVFWASIAIAVAAVVYLGILQWQATEDANVESVGARPDFSASASASPSPSLPASESASPSPSPSPTGPVLVAAPARVRIPAIDVDTKIFPVGLDENRAIEIPEDIRYVGWYKLGVPPGVDRGSAVLVAHRDGREQGRGVFYFLGNLDVGDKVYVETTDGNELPYRVVSRESILKKRLPYEELFAVDGDPRLTLISCGGYYDRNNGGYQDNVVVTAVPMFRPISTETFAAPAPSASATPSTSVSPSASASPSPVAAPAAATIAEPVKKKRKAATLVAVPAATSPSATPTPSPSESTPAKKKRPDPVFSNAASSPSPTPTASLEPVPVGSPEAATVVESPSAAAASTDPTPAEPIASDTSSPSPAP